MAGLWPAPTTQEAEPCCDRRLVLRERSGAPEAGPEARSAADRRRESRGANGVGAAKRDELSVSAGAVWLSECAAP